MIAQTPQTETAPLSYTLKEAARLTGVSRTGLWRQCRDGKLESFRYAGRTLIPADALQAAIDAARKAPRRR